jgi:hypothetical protein
MYDLSDRQAIAILDSIPRSFDLGDLIRWNACYHLECNDLPFRGRVRRETEVLH